MVKFVINIFGNYHNVFFVGQLWDKVFKNGPSKICGRQPLKNFTWSILEYFVPDVPAYAVSGEAAVIALIASVQAFIKVADRRQAQFRSSKKFGKLMMKMILCETKTEYERLWDDHNKVLKDKLVLPKKLKQRIILIFL